jgi:hypothetical protein
MPINKIKAGSIDTGSITSAKIADGTIANADISSSAAIAYSKLNLATSIANADISSNAGITLNKISGNTGFKNVIINGGFIINQREHTSGTALASGSYGHDRWKGGASGGTYTFTQGSTGVNTTITITAGSIIQVIEGANLPVSGTYVLSWTGTAQGKIGSGSFSSSGVTGTITAGTNTNIEFNTGTCGDVQLELGSVATSFDYRNFGTELLLCQRYCYVFSAQNNQHSQFGFNYTFNSNTAYVLIALPITMRSQPTLTTTGTLVVNQTTSSGYNPLAVSALTLEQATDYNCVLNATISGGTSGGVGTFASNANTATRLKFSAEL